MSEAHAEPGRAGHPLLEITRNATMRHARRRRAIRAAVIGAVGTFAVLGAGQLGAPPAALALLAAAGALAIAALLDRGAAAESSNAAHLADKTARTIEADAPPAHLPQGAGALMHDLRAPLLSARATLELLVEGAYGDLERPAREAAERGAIAAARAAALVDLFRDDQAGDELAEPGATIETNVAPVPLGAVLVDVVAALASELEPAGATVRFDTLPAVPGDGDALFRIVANLVQNAVRHTPTGQPPRVEVSAEADVERGRWLLVVRDHGTGVDPADCERLFEPGERGASAAPGGSGLGLATARTLARDLGGDCWLEAAPGGGCRAVVGLPAEPGHFAAAA